MRKSGWIAIAGRPNAGKSTLLNRIIGSELSIVTPKAQTTREKVLGILTEPRGQIVFIDTPGIHRAKEGGINAAMMNEVREALEAPNLIWYLIDPASALEHENEVLETLTQKSLQETPVFLVFNKCDAVKKSKLLTERMPQFEEGLKLACSERGIRFGGAFSISALEGLNTDQLLAASWNHIPEGEFHFPDEEQISDRPVRFFVAEKIREQLLRQLGDELPYSCAVEIEKFSEPASPKDLVRIEATIDVERDSQKGMVIGKGGQKIKAIGTRAREEIEEFLQQKVFLGLKVRVLKDWTRNEEQLRRLGYFLPNRAAPKGKTRS